MMKNENELELESFFEAGRAVTQMPTPDLMDRIMADAEAEIILPQIVQSKLPEPRGGLFSNLMQTIGGWPVLAGMATAGVVGVWIGFSQPVGLDVVAQQLLGTDNADYLVDLVPAFETGFEEG